MFEHVGGWESWGLSQLWGAFNSCICSVEEGIQAGGHIGITDLISMWTFPRCTQHFCGHWMGRITGPSWSGKLPSPKKSAFNRKLPTLIDFSSWAQNDPEAMGCTDLRPPSRSLPDASSGFQWFQFLKYLIFASGLLSFMPWKLQFIAQAADWYLIHLCERC